MAWKGPKVCNDITILLPFDCQGYSQWMQFITFIKSVWAKKEEVKMESKLSK
jgi:hypothetical protein